MDKERDFSSLYDTYLNVQISLGQKPFGWTCFVCCRCFPINAPFTRKKMKDDAERTVCMECSKMYVLRQEMKAARKKKNASEHD